MGMHTIPVIYDPTTRRISLADKMNAYGGATTDVNSVNITVVGIVPEGTNFKARVDFAVPIKNSDSNVINPYVVLEQNNEIWSATIPNAILAATRDMRGKMPIQLVLANDEQVINSRNTILLEVTQAIEADSSNVPEYVVPEWTVSEQVILDDINVHTINVTYDPQTRMMTLDDDGSRYGGATIDTFSVRINVTGIPADYDARVDIAVPMELEDHKVIKPFVVLEKINNTWCAMIPQAILMAAKEIKKFPFQLVTRHGDTVINSRNTLILEITRAINAMESVFGNYTPYVMYRNDTWAWLPDFTYGMGSIVTKDGELYISIIDNNLGHDPEGPAGREYWELKSNTIPDNGEQWQILGVDSEHVYDPIWKTVSEKHEVSLTAENLTADIAHQFGNRPVTCTFYESGAEVEVPYTCGNGQVSIETAGPHDLTVVITALPYQVII